MRFILALSFALLCAGASFAQLLQPAPKRLPIPSQVSWRFSAETAAKANHEPEKAQFVTSDIDNFWRAYDLAAKETTLEKKQEIYQREYLDKGSQGLKDFIILRIKNVESLVQTIEKHPRYYASIRQQTLKIAALSNEIRKSFSKLKALYADAIFPDVYFVIGRLNSGGTTSQNGLLIGAEMYGLTKETPMAELDGWLKQVLKSTDTIPAIASHESVHIQQNYIANTSTLLAQSIKEGAADFIGQMMAGEMINQHLHVYGNPKERQLWEEFKPAMNEKSYTGWLYDGAAAKGRPADLGYYIGYKICDAYYRQAKDKAQAIKDILSITDFAQFLKDSQYEAKFVNG